MKEKLFDLTYKYGAIFLLVAIIIYFGAISSAFLTANNFFDIFRSIAIVTVLALGVTFAISVNGFDLSVGSTMSLSTVLTASFMVWYELPLWLVLILPLVVGAIVGLLNAFLIVVVGIPDILATLGMMYVIAGVHRTYTEGYSVYDNMPFVSGGTAPGVIYDSFLWIGQGKLLGIPSSIWITVILVVLSHVILKYTKFGRIFYMTGSNENATTLSGINVKKVKTQAYVISGVFASIAGILYTSRVGSGQIDSGASMLMEAVAAVFIGYCVFAAGKPNALGTFFGAAVLGILLNGLTIQNMPYYAFDIVKGAVLIVALAVTYIHIKKKKSAL